MVDIGKHSGTGAGMAADGEVEKRGIGKAGGAVALATVLSGLATFYAVAKDEVLGACAAFDVAWCQSGTKPQEPAGPRERTTVTSTSSPLAGSQGISIAIEPLHPSDAGQAAALMQHLKSSLGPVGAAASGYQIVGVVSGFSNLSSQRAHYTLSWKIRKGQVEVPCSDVPVLFKSNMIGADALIVSAALSPSIAESVKFQDVRCS